MGEETWPLQRNRTEHFVHWKNERCLSKSHSVGVSDDELVFGEMMVIRFSQDAGGVPPRNPGVGEAKVPGSRRPEQGTQKVRPVRPSAARGSWPLSALPPATVSLHCLPTPRSGLVNPSGSRRVSFYGALGRYRGFPGGSSGRLCLHCRRLQFDPWVGKIPWSRKWHPL